MLRGPGVPVRCLPRPPDSPGALRERRDGGAAAVELETSSIVRIRSVAGRERAAPTAASSSRPGRARDQDVRALVHIASSCARTPGGTSPSPPVLRDRARPTAEPGSRSPSRARRPAPGSRAPRLPVRAGTSTQEMRRRGVGPRARPAARRAAAPRPRLLAMTARVRPRAPVDEETVLPVDEDIADGGVVEEGTEESQGGIGPGRRHPDERGGRRRGGLGEGKPERGDHHRRR